MGFKNLLVHVAADKANAARIDYALRLAAAHGAHLTALHVPVAPFVPGFAMVEVTAELAEARERYAREEAERLEREVRAASSRAGAAVEWRTGAGDLIDTALLHARHADIAIVGQGADDNDSDRRSSLPFLLESLLLGSGRPVLAIPSYGTYPTLGERVLVCWNATREAARAVNDALPVLRRAQQVTVLSIDPINAQRRIPGADIAVHLARHGVKVEAMSAYAEDLDVGDVILSRAADLGADMIVMGGYGHSRTREILLGGATRHILRHMTAPVLMSH